MITTQTFRNLVIKSDNLHKISDNLEQMTISIENKIKIFTLVQRESKRLSARKKHSELEKFKYNNEMRMAISKLYKT